MPTEIEFRVPFTAFVTVTLDGGGPQTITAARAKLRRNIFFTEACKAFTEACAKTLEPGVSVGGIFSDPCADVRAQIQDPMPLKTEAEEIEKLLEENATLKESIADLEVRDAEPTF
jgi:hypothetical protein